MAGTSLKLVNKLNRRNKKVKEHARGFDRFDEVFLNPKILAESPRAFELMRQAERRRERAFGHFALGKKPELHHEYVAVSLTKSGSNLVLTLTAGEEGFAGTGTLAGDWVEITQHGSQAYGQYLKVLSVTSTTLVLSDVNFAGYTIPFTGTETNVTCRIEINGPKSYY